MGRYDMKFDFKQIKLQNFVGHAGAVRSIYVLNNENSFLTASKDKTVKLYSLRNQVSLQLRSFYATLSFKGKILK